MIIGLTGKSGAGKSTFAKLFIGYDIIDCDKIYSELLAKNNAMQQELLETYGTCEKIKLREMVFNDINKLNQITWKYVIEEVKNRVTENCIIEAIGLFESGLSCLCDKTIAVVSSENMNRIMNRDSLSLEEASMRLNSQKDIEFYRKNADYIVEN